MGIVQKLIVNTTFLIATFLVLLSPTTFKDSDCKPAADSTLRSEENTNIIAPGDTVAGYYGDSEDNQFWQMIFHESEDAYFAVGERKEDGVAVATITRINPCGYVEWTRTYFTDIAFAAYADIEIMDDGQLLVLGRQRSGASSFSEMRKTLSKIDAATGDIIWSRYYEDGVRFGKGDLVKAIGDPAGEVYYMTHWYQVDNTIDDMAFVKFDNMGNIIWQRRYDHISDDDELGFTLPLPGGQLLNVGLTTQDRDAFIFLMDGDGSVLSSRKFSVPGTEFTHFRSVQQLADGGFLIHGYINSNADGKNHLIVRLDNSFNVQFARAHLTNYDVDAGAMAKDADGDLYLMRYLQLGGENKLAVMKYNSTAAFLWMRYFDVNSVADINMPFEGVRYRPDSDQLIFTDIGQPNGGFGGNDAFFAVTDTELSSCITETFSPTYTPFTVSASNFPLTATITNYSTGDYTDTGSIDYELNAVCTAPIELCSNGIDDDCDGLVDCNDPDLQDSCCCIGPIMAVDLGMDDTVCVGSSLLLNAGSGYAGYLWQDGSMDSTLLASIPGLYSVTVTNGCEISADTINVSFVEPPMPTSETVSICDGDTAFVLGNIVTQTDTFTQQLEASNGCDSIHTIFVNVSAAVTLTDTVLAIPCANQSNGIVAVTPETGMAPFDFEWDFGDETTETLSDLPAGDYSVTVTDQNGCTAEQAISLEEQFDWDITLPEDVTINLGETFEIEAEIDLGGIFDYEWMPSTALSCNDCPDPAASPVETTTYTLTATDEAGCLDSASLTITVNTICGEDQLGIPNAFTPNSDGVNDFFGLMNPDGLEQVNSIKIFDRWGSIVFQGTSRDDRWDGTQNGGKLPAGVYIYMIEYECPDGSGGIASGDLTLIR